VDTPGRPSLGWSRAGGFQTSWLPQVSQVSSAFLLRTIQGATHGIGIPLDGRGHRAGGNRVALIATKFSGEISGDASDAFQKRNQRGRSRAWHAKV